MPGLLRCEKSPPSRSSFHRHSRCHRRAQAVLHCRPASPRQHRTFVPLAFTSPYLHRFVPTLIFTRRLSRSGETVVLAEDEATRQSGIYLATMTRPRNADEDTVMSSSVDALADTSEVVVKFTAQYHPKAHCLLAKVGLAPALHACVPVCGG